MFHQVEFRSVIRFLFLKKFNATQIIQELKEVYGESSPSQRTVYEWLAHFKNGRTNVMDEKSSGRPQEIPDSKKEALTKIIKNDKRITTRNLTNILNVSKGTLHTFLRQLGVRRLCSRFVPKFLTAEMMQRRFDCCNENISIFDEEGERMLSNIVTMDETPLSLYNPESRRESTEWKFPGEEATRKLRATSSHRKALMLTTFWDAQGLVLMDFTDGSCNSSYYIEVMNKARKIRRKPRNNKLWLLQDNAPSHSSFASQDAIAASGFSLLPHPPYSPDLAPSDFYLFRHLKKHLKGNNYGDITELKNEVEQFLIQQPSDFYRKGFDQLVQRWRKCIVANMVPMLKNNFLYIFV